MGELALDTKMAIFRQKSQNEYRKVVATITFFNQLHNDGSQNPSPPFLKLNFS